MRVVSPAILLLIVRHLVAHKVVAGVTVGAMACGVASMVATQLMYESVVTSYETTALRFAGRAALQVTNGDSGVPEEIADELRLVPGVRGVAASVEGFVAVPDLPGERLYVYGVDLLADQQIREYGSTSDAVVSDPLVFLAAPDSVALTAEFAQAHRLGLQDRLRVLAPVGVVDLTIRAVLGNQHGPASVFDGRVAVVDLSVAQALLQSEGRVSELAIEVAADADLDAVERAVVQTVGGHGAVERPTSRAAAFARLMTNYRYGLLLAAATSMIVALYFVFNMATIAVVERRQELGLLRALGLCRHEVVVLVVGELLALSAVASGMGIPAGLGLARLLAGALGASVAALYTDIGVPLPELHYRPVLWGVTLGMLTPLVAAVGPILRVVRLRPLEVLRSAAAERPQAMTYLASTLGGAAIITLSGAAWVARAALPMSKEAAGIVAMLGAIVGIAFLVPMAVRLLAELGDRLATRRLGPLSMLATRNVTSEIGRIAITCSAVLVSLAGTIAIATWLASLDATLSAAFDTVFAKIDLMVSSGADPFAVAATRIPGPVVDAIAALPEIAYVDPIRINTMAFAGSLVAVVARDARLYAEGRRTLSMIEGDGATAGRELVSGSSVVVNQTFASRFNRHPGDMLELATPGGALRLRIAGIYLELAPGDLATIHLDRSLYRRWWRDETASVVAVSLRRGGDRSRVIAALRAQWGERHRLVVLTLQQLRREYQGMLTHLTALVYPLLGSAVLVALVGIVSARVTSIIARTRVSGVLRAIGATRRQLARVFVIEAAIVGGVSAALAAVVGSALGRMQVEVLLRGMLGMSILYSYPRAVALLGGMGVVLLTSAGGWVLGRRASRLAVSAALRWE